MASELPSRQAAAHRLEEALTALIIAAPASAPEPLAAALTHVLEAALASAHEGRSAALGLACAIERCLRLMPRGLVDAGIALPVLAMAAATLGGSVAAAHQAAWYEVDTLLPVPASPAPRRAGPEVAVGALVRHRPSAGLAAEPRLDEPTLESLAAGWPEAAVAEVMAALLRYRA